MEFTGEMSTLPPPDIRGMTKPVVTTACAWYHIGIRVIVGGFLVIFGLLGNSLTLAIVSRMRSKPSSMHMLFYLVIADCFILGIFGPMAVVRPVLDLSGLASASHNLHIIGIACLSPVGNVVNLVIILLTVAVTWQRYISVHNPHKAKIYTSAYASKIIALSCMVFSLLFHLPNICEFQLRLTQDGQLQMIKAEFAKSRIYYIVYNLVLYYLITYILPVIALVMMAGALVKNLCDHKKMTSGQNSASNKAREDLTILVIVVAVIFIICQSFNPTRKILMHFFEPYPMHLQCGGSLFYFGPLYLISYLVNSACNFLVFLCCAKGFKKKVRNFLFGQSRVGPQSSVASTSESNNAPLSHKASNIKIKCEIL